MGVEGNVRELQQAYHVTKRPAIIAASPRTIECDFNAPNFLVHFNAFLTKHIPASTLVASDNMTFSIYKRLVLFLPGIPEVTSGKSIQDVLYATMARERSVTNQGNIKQSVAAKASTILVCVNPANKNEGPLDSKSSACQNFCSQCST